LPPYIGGAFTILQFADENLEDVLYLENAGGERTIRADPYILADYYETFATLEGMATHPSGLSEALEKIEAQRFKDTADPLTASPIPQVLDQ
jgi:hypothetical protein